MAAKTIFVMSYTGAIEGSNRWLRPNQVTKMTDSQAVRKDLASREAWAKESLKSGAMKNIPDRWYETDTREPIRDETLRSGLVVLGAVVERPGLATTSDKPRYALAADFADLLIQLSSGTSQPGALITQWQSRHLTSAALSRVTLLRRGAIHSASSDRIKVTFPNGETRLMRPGPSTTITKAVVEEFARRFLREPGVVLLSESGDKVVLRDEALATSIGLRLDYSRNLPDVILADVHREAHKVVFIEVVASDGVVTEQRKQALLRVASDAGFAESNVYFVSAFADRSAAPFRKLVSEIAWGSFAWFVAEPEKLLVFREGRSTELSALFTG
jgi:hypothetical protein